ncbi:dihydrofolate reductase family protein [Leptospira bouyouniensis]|uniref:dihydrofolate reductase family protein n=1 Tax=Leptospira bouyouniensis TaxID=2484911 RepID=UPI0010913CBF|nr:dihydrofolate reductase family protein [Leptospira bouyouniensis]TGM74944.1 dihydrofolate reductase [Leptospira bouyouniensis]
MISLKAYIASSLDGFIAKKDGSVDWLHAEKYHLENEDFGYTSFMESIDCIVMGRITFETVLQFEPYPFENVPVIVVSNNPNYQIESKHDISIFTHPIRELISYLKTKAYQNVYVDGGKLIQSFLKESLLDEITITQIPILLGSGIPLFGVTDRMIELKHRKTQTFPNGFVQNEYEIVKNRM